MVAYTLPTLKQIFRESHLDTSATYCQWRRFRELQLDIWPQRYLSTLSAFLLLR